MKQYPPIRFSKMHGLGNDFVVIESISQQITLSPEIITKLSNRHLGIGFDQLLLVSKENNNEFVCQIFNADGTEAEQCGNGLRCVGRFLFDKDFISNRNFFVKTKAGSFEVSIQDNELIQVNMGLPCFIPNLIPFNIEEERDHYQIPLSSHEIIEASVLSMGNPHVIVTVPSVSEIKVETIGPLISNHPLFPKGTNVGFMEVKSPTKILLRTYERGVGETFACGSNACAAVVAGIKNNTLENTVTVALPHGELIISWQNIFSSVQMTGPALNIFEGIISSF